MNKHEAIYKLYSNVVYINNEIPYDVNNNVIIIDNALVEAEVAKHAYIPQRATEYPSIQDQLDTLYHKGYEGWKATIEAVKNKYPKGK
jgi:methyl coenzyme M reductase subunit C-like uncharacterized protein (methanogenesis marker protein 7)